MTTIKDVARLAHVALSTASLALQRDPRVKESTRQKVLQAAKELQYRPNGIARDLKAKRTETVCVLVHDLGGPFYSELLRGVQEVALQNGYNIVASGAIGGNQGSAARLLLENRVDGAIVLAPAVSDEFVSSAASENLPIVVLDRDYSASNVYSVRTGNEDGGYQATRHLLELGHHEIAYIAGPPDSLDGKQRYLGYRRALAEFGVPESKRFELGGNFTEEGGYQAAISMMAQRLLPTAVFAANDEMALGVLRAFQERGLRVPNDVALVGFDDIRLAEYVSPPLTTVRQPMYELGTVAAHVLFRAMAGEKDIQDVVLPIELVVRESSGLYRENHS